MAFRCGRSSRDDSDEVDDDQRRRNAVCQSKLVMVSIDCAIGHNSFERAVDNLIENEPNKLPIVYHPRYNISFIGLEKIHPFDAGKWGNVINILDRGSYVKRDRLVEPSEAQRDDLLVVHTERYLNSLQYSCTVAMVTEVPFVACLPNILVQNRVLCPFRYHVGGTILAAYLATGGKNAEQVPNVDKSNSTPNNSEPLERWAINIGGGFHHCSADQGGGFCAYADITLAIRFLQVMDRIKRAVIVDLDAHQGNGHERDFTGDDSVFIVDVYNREIYPGDREAKRGIKAEFPIRSGIGDTMYLTEVERALDSIEARFPEGDLLVYNAGTDIMDGDPLGAMCISPDGIIKRDEMVFEYCRRRRLPIVMVTSGGYQRSTAQVIARSIENIISKGIVHCPKESSS